MTNFDFSKTLYGKCFEENKRLREENEELKNDIKLFVANELCELAYRFDEKDPFFRDYLYERIEWLKKNSYEKDGDKRKFAIKVLTKAKFDIQNIFNQVDKYDGEYCELYWKLSKFFNQFNDYFDKQIENLKGE